VSIECWKAVLGWEGLYEVSDQGNVRSIRRERMTNFGERFYGGGAVKPIMGTRKYLVVNLTSPDGRRKQYFLHKLVLEAFIGPRPNGMQACHGNGIRTDCSLVNLRWDSIKANHADKVAHGTAQRGERGSNAKYTEATVRTILAEKLTAKEASIRFSIPISTAEKIVSRTTWKHVNA
jgi:NUMOD4 motif/HNH endonuclease